MSITASVFLALSTPLLLSLCRYPSLADYLWLSLIVFILSVCAFSKREEEDVAGLSIPAQSQWFSCSAHSLVCVVLSMPYHFSRRVS